MYWHWGDNATTPGGAQGDISSTTSVEDVICCRQVSEAVREACWRQAAVVDE